MRYFQIECRLCRFLICVFFAIFASNSFAQCGDEDYINWMSQLIKEKKQKLGDVAKLIPTSLAIAQSALETGYGTSYAATKRNNHFGLSPGGKLANFSSPKESVRYYLENLTMHNAYAQFRSKMLDGVNDSLVLVKYIAPAYAQDKKYARDVSHIIRECKLQRFDLDLYV